MNLAAMIFAIAKSYPEALSDASTTSCCAQSQHPSKSANCLVLDSATALRFAQNDEA
jgi:hypothetical protein